MRQASAYLWGSFYTLPMWISLLVSFPLAAPAQAQGDLHIAGAALVDPRTETVRRADVWILDGKVAALGPQRPSGFDGETLDASGLFVIPGLHDLHSHTYGNGSPSGRGEFFGTGGSLKRALAVGVVGVLDLFGLEAVILAQRDRQRSDPRAVAGADLFAAGPCLTASDGHCTEYPIPTRVIDTPEDAIREITQLALKRPDVVKIVYHEGSMPTIDRATLEAAIQTATALELKTMVHVGSWEFARHAAEAGATAITHGPDGAAELVPRDVIEAIKKSGTVVVPTLSVYLDRPALVAEPELLENDLLRTVASPSLLAKYRDPAYRHKVAAELASFEQDKSARLGSVRQLDAAGVLLLTGTDAGGFGVFQGYSVHREMLWLERAGLTRWKALAAATTLAGDFLGRSAGFVVGDTASFVVLDRSPLADIRNTQRIVAVVHRGRVVDRQALTY